MTSYLQIIHFIALEPTLKKILSIQNSIFYTSAVLKLLQQKYKLQKGPLWLSKTVISFSTSLLVLEKICKEIFWHILACCVAWVHLMKLLCTKFVGTNPSYMCAKNKIFRCSSF
jgi:hypothetical protein